MFFQSLLYVVEVNEKARASTHFQFLTLAPPGMRRELTGATRNGQHPLRVASTGEARTG